MRPSTGALEISLSVAALMVVMLGVMWAQRPASMCTMPSEAVRRLVLTRDTDREHLTRDRAAAVRIEERYREASARSDSDQQACAATLVQQIMALHAVTFDQASTTSDAR